MLNGFHFLARFSHKLESCCRRWFFVFVGTGSLLWFLIRVIPKPSRAAYPCMRVAAPIASSFVLYLLGLFPSIVAFIHGRRQFRRARYGIALLCIMAAIVSHFWMVGIHPQTSYGASFENVANDPMGTARGIFPGRVVWVHDPGATRDDCNPTLYGHGWFLNENNNQAVIDRMVSTVLRSVSGEASDRASWEAVFKFYNQQHGKGPVDYQAGEKILIKTNATSAWSGNYQTSDLSDVYNSSYGISETSPQLVLSVLRQLIHTVGVAEGDIYVGDPMKHIYKHCYDIWHSEFPNVNYLDHDYGAEKGRVKAVANPAPSLFYSDRGRVLGSAYKNETIYKIFDDAEYLINLPTMKAHSYAGVTMFAKNHFGSQTRSSASHLHKGLVATVDRGVVTRGGYGLYRVQVDLMGHKVLGGKNLIYLMDALWSSDFEIGPPVKWQMPPFNNDWTSSLFASLDPVAIESVGYDFLHTEFTGAGGRYSYAQMPGTDDYLHQAASPANWPANITYDPENDGTPIACLGVHEHWNNSIDKQYSRNLGTGDGIELLKFDTGTGVKQDENASITVGGFELLPNYPNPFNAATIIAYSNARAAQVELSIHAVTGQRIRSLVDGPQPPGIHRVSWDGRSDWGDGIASGSYVYRLRITIDGRTHEVSRRLVLIK